MILPRAGLNGTLWPYRFRQDALARRSGLTGLARLVCPAGLARLVWPGWFRRNSLPCSQHSGNSAQRVRPSSIKGRLALTDSSKCRACAPPRRIITPAAGLTQRARGCGRDRPVTILGRFFHTDAWHRGCPCAVLSLGLHPLNGTTTACIELPAQRA